MTVFSIVLPPLFGQRSNEAPAAEIALNNSEVQALLGINGLMKNDIDRK